MNNIRTFSLLPLLLALVCCNGPENPSPSPTPTPTPDPDPVKYTTLAELSSKMESSSKEFDINIKNLVVTAVYENYAQLEDGTSGAQLNKSGHSLKVGQLIEGSIKGKAKVVSNSLTFTELTTSGATVKEGQTVPCTEVKLKDVLDGGAKYTNRRLNLKNITFVYGYSGKADASGTISQSGVQVSSVCRPSGVVIADGSQGDIIGYYSGSVIIVYEKDVFKEHPIVSPITVRDVPGVYKLVSDVAQGFVTATDGTCQYAYGINSNNREFRLQNYDQGWLVGWSFTNKTLKPGMEVSLNADVYNTSNFQRGESKVFVEKVSDEMVWLMDYTGNLGYVFKLAQE